MRLEGTSKKKWFDCFLASYLSLITNSDHSALADMY